MNSDTARLLRQYDPSEQLLHPHAYGSPQYAPDRLWDRLTQPSIAISFLLLLLAVLYQVAHGIAASRDRPLPPLPELLWNAVVYLTPASLLFAVDGWLNPPLFPLPMLHAQPRTHAAKSDVLRRMLGVDRPGAIMMSVSQAGRRSLSTLSGGGLGGDKSAIDRPAGLGNWDNSCYQNSILQGLASLKALPRYLAVPAAEAEQQHDDPRGRTAETLRDLIADLNNPLNNGKTLWTPGVLKNMSTWQQQDAQEYFSKLLDEIDRDVARALRAAQRPSGFETGSGCAREDDAEASQHSDDSGYQSLSSHSKAGSSELLRLVRNPLEGLVAQRVACVACGHSEGLSMIPFNCLTLNLGVNRPEYDLYERLDSYTRVESIQGVECSKCTLLKFKKLIGIIIERSRAAGVPDEEFPEPFARLAAVEAALEEDAFDDATLSAACKIPAAQRVASTKTKQVVIARPPQSLVIHMNRSVFDEVTGRMFKNLAAVRFPHTLDLGPWCLGSADGFTSDTAGGASKKDVTPTDGDAPLQVPNEEEQWLLDPRSSMVAGDAHLSKITGPIYELSAVVTHYGRHENGHYVCYRRHPRRVPRGRADGRADEKAERPANLAAEGEVDHGLDDVDVNAGAEAVESTAVDAGRLDADDIARAGEEDEAGSQWWRLSDQDVTRADEETVLAQGGVFMLFYDCVDPHSVLSSEVDAFVDAKQGQDEEGQKSQKRMDWGKQDEGSGTEEGKDDQRNSGPESILERAASEAARQELCVATSPPEESEAQDEEAREVRDEGNRAEREDEGPRNSGFESAAEGAASETASQEPSDDLEKAPCWAAAVPIPPEGEEDPGVINAAQDCTTG